ncbi:MAG: DUF58 domain-containing protein [Treponema sp.]|nr:DUF58 domain-containing protein [Treponema sp.]
MDRRELLGRIRRLLLLAEGLAASMLAGGFRSVFRGQGMEFDEARHYQWGDDARSIDWNASTRLGAPFVKVFREERELGLFLLLDTSASMRGGMSRPFGAGAGDRRPSPYEQALIASALVTFAADRNGQRVGAFLFDREIDRVFPPRTGRRNVLAFLSAALKYQDAGAAPSQTDLPGSNLRAAIAAANLLLKRKSLVVLVSDFLSIGWEQELGRLAGRNDVVAVRVFDPVEGNLPDLGLLEAADPETGTMIAAPTGSASFREAWRAWHRERAELWRKLCRRAGASLLELPVTEDAGAVLTRFFGNR